MTDLRNIACGRVIPTQSYADQPYVIVLPDASWLCVLTTGAGEEGEAGQHIVALRSFNRGESWETPVPIEPADGPEASWAVPLQVPGIGGVLGRIYVFYGYNRDNLREVIADDDYGRKRVDTLGYYCFHYSDDGGQTWSNERFEVPVRVFEIDRENPYGGEVRFFWSVCKPLVHEDRVFLAVHKVGRFGDGFMARSEGAFLVSDNILTEPDPAQIRWQTLPDGEVGLRATERLIADEQNITALSDGSLFCTYRTIEGHPCHAYSRDGGHTWSAPAHMTYGPGQRKVKHPRAANFVRRFSNGKFLYWFHNHGLKGYDGRNPAWLIGGEEIETPQGRQIQWSQPEIVLYDDEIGTRVSYPDFIEQDGELFVTETQKTIARSHTVAPELLDWLWQGPGRAEISVDGLAATLAGPGPLDMPHLPSLGNCGGFSLDFQVRFDDLSPHQLLFDSRDECGSGIVVSLTDRATLDITLRGSLVNKNVKNGSAASSWECDPGLVEATKWHRVTAIVDGGPKLLLWVVDGHLCDGGAARPFGWGRFHADMDDVAGASHAKIAPSVRGELATFRLYDRALYTNEAAANHRVPRSI